jgi:hypothetical protein
VFGQVLLILLWAGGYFFFSVGALIHAPLVIAIILIAWHFVMSSPTTGPP